MSAATSLLAELRYADQIIKVLLNALTMEQKAQVGRKLEAAGLVSDGMTRHRERRAAIEAATTAPTSCTSTGRLNSIAQQAATIVAEARAAEELLHAMPKTGTGDVPAIVWRRVALMRGAAQTITALAAQGGAV